MSENYLADALRAVLDSKALYSEPYGAYPVAREALARLDADRAARREWILVDQDEDEVCPLCHHEWKRHDPADGMCDAHAEEGFGACPCGRDIAFMRTGIAVLSRVALDPEPAS